MGRRNENSFKPFRSHDQSDYYDRRVYLWYKNLKYLLQNQLTEGLDTWYVASGTRVLPRLFKRLLRVDLDLKKGQIGENAYTIDFI